MMVYVKDDWVLEIKGARNGDLGCGNFRHLQLDSILLPIEKNDLKIYLYLFAGDEFIYYKFGIFIKNVSRNLANRSAYCIRLQRLHHEKLKMPFFLILTNTFDPRLCEKARMRKKRQRGCTN